MKNLRMKTWMKTSLGRCFFTLACLIGGSSIWGQVIDVEHLRYRLFPESQTAVVIGWSSTAPENLTELIIPSSISNGGTVYTVTRINKISKKEKDRESLLMRVKLPESLVSIGDSAFIRCESLTAIDIPNGVTTIGEYAFAYCRDLKEVKLPERLTVLQNSSFNNCSALKSVTIPNSVVSIEEYAFVSCGSLKTVTFGNDLKRIGACAFLLCENLISVDIPNRVELIEREAFENCTRLQTVTFGSGLKRIGERAFADCTHLMSVDIPDNVTDIEEGAFMRCESLKSARLSESITKISKSLFAYCKSLDGIKIPGRVENIEEFAFNSCERLLTITIPENVRNIELGAFLFCVRMQSVKIEEGVTQIGEGVFEECHKLAGVTIPNSVISVGAKAFASCMSLKTATLSENLTTIENGTFRGCLALQSIVIPHGVTTIGSYAFSNCLSMKMVKIPESVTQIQSAAFSICPELMEIYASPNTAPVLEEDVFSGLKKTARLYKPEGAVGYTENAWGLVGVMHDELQFRYELFPETLTAKVVGVTSFGRDVHDMKYPADPLIIPSRITVDGNTYTVNTLKEGAFKEISLIHLVLPETLTFIERGAFIGAEIGRIDALAMTAPALDPMAFENAILSSWNSSLHFPVGAIGYREGGWNVIENFDNALKYPYRDLFYDYVCSVENGTAELTKAHSLGILQDTLYIPERIYAYGREFTVTSVGEGAFEYEMPAMKASFAKFPNTIETIGARACKGNIWLTSVKLPDNLTRIEEETFKECFSLLGMEFPASVTHIGARAFFACTSLPTLNLPQNINVIAEGLFTDCVSLTSLDIPVNVTSIGDHAFFGCAKLPRIVFPSNVKHIGLQAFELCNNLSEVDFSENMTSIGSSAFQRCPKLVSVQLPDNITTIEENAFSECISLTSLKLPKGLNVINSRLFEGCLSLTSVDVPEGVTTIGTAAFADCKSLSTLALPEKLNLINEQAFKNCYALSALDIPKNVEQMKDEAFANCVNLSTLNNFSGKMTEIGKETFKNCVSLNTVNLSESLVKIGNFAFLGCNTLRSIIIHDKISDYGYCMLENCRALQDIYVYARNAPNESTAYGGIIAEGVTLHAIPGALGYEMGYWLHPNVTVQYDLGEQLVDKVNYTMTENASNITIPYVRNYKHTGWQPLFVPFDIPYSALGENFEVAQLIDGQEITESVKFTMLRENQTLPAHSIALIRSKKTGRRTLLVENTQRYAAPNPAVAVNAEGFVFKGTYESIQPDMLETLGAYVMKGGMLHPYRRMTDSAQPLGAYRWYLVQTTGGGTSKLRIEIGDLITHLDVNEEALHSEASNAVIYTLDGRRVMGTPTKGIYIVNGKKVFR